MFDNFYGLFYLSLGPIHPLFENSNMPSWKTVFSWNFGKRITVWPPYKWISATVPCTWKYSSVESANRGSRGKSLKFNPPGPHAGGLNNSELTDHHWEIVTFCWAASMDSFIWKRKLWIDWSATSLVTWNEVFRCQILPHTPNSIDHWILKKNS